MAEVSSISQLNSQSRVTTSYIPAFPPKAPRETSSYSRFLQDAPYSALSGINADGRVPERHSVLPRYRERRQVGESNRWRLPERLYSDLLGKAQALKAINMPYNSTMVRIITGMDHKVKPSKIPPPPWAGMFHSETCPILPPQPTDKGYNNKVSKAADIETARRKLKMKDTYLPDITKSMLYYRKQEEDSQPFVIGGMGKICKGSNQSDVPEPAAVDQGNGADLEEDNLDKEKGAGVTFVDDC